MKKYSSFLLMFGLMLLFFFSCREEECDQTLRTEAVFSFLTIQPEGPIDTALPVLTVYGETRKDSLLYDSASTIEQVSLPLDPSRDYSRFVFQTDSLSDTVELTYNRHQKFLSHECGFITEYEIQQAATTNHHFDSIATVKPYVNINEDETHINIYLPAADTSGN